MILKKLFPIVLALLIALSPVCASAADGDLLAADSIVSYAKGSLSVQEWLDGPVCEGAGSTMDGLIVALNRTNHSYDLSRYADAASALIENGGISNPVTLQRCALALISCGRGDALPASLADDTIGKLGVMSYVFGLHLLNNGAPSDLWTPETIIDQILSLRKADGGWAVTGNFGDPDVTAMCLQALACNDDIVADEIIESALDFLSGKQLESGGFSSYGKENCESAAQVLIALASLGVDANKDERFIKNGRGVVDAMQDYRCENGGFSHLLTEKTDNITASLQAYQAFIAHASSGVPFYDFSAPRIEVEETTGTFPAWKLYALIAVGIIFLAGTVFSITRKHGRMKQLLFVWIICIIAAAAVLMIDISTTSSYYSDASARGKQTGEVHMTILCNTLVETGKNASIPDNGEILPRTAFACYEGDSVFDILTDAARRYEIHIEHEGGTGDTAYVRAINNLYEYQYGDLSGWLFKINGETPSIGSGACRVTDGDEIIWQYSLELGEDIK